MEPERIVPDGRLHAGPEAFLHGPQAKEVIAKLKEVQEVVQTLGETNQLSEGGVLQLSNLLRTTFEQCEKLELEASKDGAIGVAMATLVRNPYAASNPTLAEFLCDKGFCKVLRNAKIELLRIKRGNPKQDARLTAHEVENLEAWGKTLVVGVMSAWAMYFTSFGPKMAVPPKFQSLVCALVVMGINLWPFIKPYLARWRIEGDDIFPEHLWTDAYLNEVMIAEPRIVSFVAGASDDLDMYEAAQQGPVLRAQRKAREKNRAAYDALKPSQRHLVDWGIDIVQTVYEGKASTIRDWSAISYKWPREGPCPRPSDLLGDPLGIETQPRLESDAPWPA